VIEYELLAIYTNRKDYQRAAFAVISWMWRAWDALHELEKRAIWMVRGLVHASRGK
jgi:hypothetical protein